FREAGNGHDEDEKAGEAQAAGLESTHDYYYWSAILRSLSAFENYRKAYRDAVTPARVAELLILNPDMPRSLLTCMNEVMTNLRHVRSDASAETERFAGKLHAQLSFDRVEDILEQGMHAYLTRFLEQAYDLGNRLSHDFMVPLAA